MRKLIKCLRRIRKNVLNKIHTIMTIYPFPSNFKALGSRNIKLSDLEI